MQRRRKRQTALYVRRTYTYDKKTGRKRRIDMKRSRAIRMSPKFKRYIRKPRKQQTIRKMKMSLRRANKQHRTKYGRRTKWKPARKVPFHR